MLVLPWTPLLSLMLNTAIRFPRVGIYRRLVGKLIYPTITRPDITTYVVGIVNQYMHAHCQPHFEVVCSILCYLKGAHGRGLLYWLSNSLPLIICIDADYIGSCSDRRSTFGFCLVAILLLGIVKNEVSSLALVLKQSIVL